MYFTIVFLLIFLIDITFKIIYAIKSKHYTSLLNILFVIPWLVFFFSDVFLGGSAFNKASSSYNEYIEGHYYLFSHGVYTEVTYNQFIYMKVMEIVGIISWTLGFILSIIVYKKHKGEQQELVNSNDSMNTQLEKRCKDNKIFIGLSFGSVTRFLFILFILSSLAVFFIRDFDYILIPFILIFCYMAFNMIYMFLSVCHFKKETIRVKSDCLFKKSQAQKRFEIAYKDIDSIELVNLQAGFDTHNKQIMEKGNDYTYEFIYQVDSLSCILIHIKNKEDVEGIVLDNYSSKQKSIIYSELSRRINNNKL